MAYGKKGQKSKAASLLLVALALSMAGAAPGQAQDTGTPTPAPSSTRPLDFRLPPADEGRTPGVQGPSNNGLPPIAPGERRGPPQPTPTPAPVPPRVIPTQPTTIATPDLTPARRDPPATTTPRAAPARDETAPAQSDAQDSQVLPPLQPGASDIALPTDAAPPVVDDGPAAAAPPSTSAGTPLWAWILAALAALGAGFWYWRRRMAFAGSPVDDIEEAPRLAQPPAEPRAATPPPTRPAPRSVPAAPPPKFPDEPRPASPLVTRAVDEQRALVSMTLDVRSIRFAPDHVAVGFGLNLVNQGALPATGLMVRIALNQGSAMPEAVLGRFFDGAGGSILRDDMALAVGAGEELSTEVMLPRAAIEPLMIGGKPMLVPVMAFDVTYHWDGEGEAFGQNAGSFVLGREQGMSANDKLAPLPLDRASYMVDRPGARATAIKRSQ